MIFGLYYSLRYFGVPRSASGIVSLCKNKTKLVLERYSFSGTFKREFFNLEKKQMTFFNDFKFLAKAYCIK